MSTVTIEMLVTIQTITDVQNTLVRITTPMLLVIGNIGEMLSIIIFLQRNFRNNTCAIYFLAAACARLIFINSFILLNGLSHGKFPWR